MPLTALSPTVGRGLSLCVGICIGATLFMLELALHSSPEPPRSPNGGESFKWAEAACYIPKPYFFFPGSRLSPI